MKKILSILTAFVFFACNQASKPAPGNDSLTNTQTPAERVAMDTVICKEYDSTTSESEASILIKTCQYGIYRTTSVGYADYKGRYSYDRFLFRKSKSGYDTIQNSEMFNDSQANLLHDLKEFVRQYYDEMFRDPGTTDCFEGTDTNFSAISINQFGIGFHADEITFYYSFGLIGACMGFDEVLINYDLDVIEPYLKK